MHDRRAIGNIGHKMPVHHVDMHPVSATLFNGSNFSPKFGKISGENGRGDEQGAGFHGEVFRNARPDCQKL